ncbi:hypothetical protein V2J09_019790 [Rumex salicifolius]
MVEIEESHKSLGDFKEEEIADTVQRNLQEEDEEELAGAKLLEPGGYGLEQVLAGTHHSDKFGDQELEQFQNVKEEEEEDDDEFDGPPPGEREQQLKRGRRDLEVEGKQELDEVGEKVKEEDEEQPEDDDDIEGPPPGWGSTLQLPHSPFSTKPSFHPSGDHDKVEEEEGDDDQMEGPPPGWASPSWQRHLSSTPPHGQCSNLLPPAKRTHVFCKSCHRHFSHPKGSIYVRCSTCQIVNQVVEGLKWFVGSAAASYLIHKDPDLSNARYASKSTMYSKHEVGQVKCENCSELLMYPNGAPSVRCTKCHFVTDIGEHNRRPLLSVQQGRSSPTTFAH